MGIPHPKWDERPLLFLVTHSGEPVDKESIRKFLSLRVAKWWIPDDIVFLSELPHGATGKLQKYGLREEYAPLHALNCLVSLLKRGKTKISIIQVGSI